MISMLGHFSKHKRNKIRIGFGLATIVVLFAYVMVFSFLPIKLLTITGLLFIAYLIVMGYLRTWYNYDEGTITLLGKEGFTVDDNGRSKDIFFNKLINYDRLGDWWTFEFPDKSIIYIKNTVTGIEQAVKHIPAEKKGVFLWHETTSRKLPVACKICGNIAVKEWPVYWCEVCNETPWKPGSGLSEEEYIRNRQLEVFAVSEEHEKVNFYLRDKDYKRDPNWRPLVTEPEVREGCSFKWSREEEKTDPIDQTRCLPCMVCGFYAIPHPNDPAAVEDNSCRVCFSQEWNVTLGTNEMDYLRECQLDHFATWDPEEKVVFYPKDVQYRPVPHWKPWVTEQEVLEYSRKENWD